ncbi:MAG: J domain-containing protein [Burkholderiales bacterium]|nr:J domain-containing protein [Burkholderiales bacterium]
MPLVHTHYENLKVARNAPPEVIRAAYRVLSQKYHPDKQPIANRADAERVMALVNQAYEILSDSTRRAEHDAWIAQQEAPSSSPAAAPAPTPAPSSSGRRASPPPPPPPERSGPVSVGYALATTLAVIVGINLLVPSKTSTTQPRFVEPIVVSPGVTEPTLRFVPADDVVLDKPAKPVVPTDPARQPRYLTDAEVFGSQQANRVADKAKPAHATTATPKPERFTYEEARGSPAVTTWPSRAAYLPGLPVFASGGLSTLTIDNGQNDSNVYVKLFSVPDGKALRHIFIPAGQSFTAAKVRAGSYEVRYKDLSTGALSASEPFELKQYAHEGGTRYSNVTMTLYKVAQGNMHMRRISEAEF